VLYRLLALKPKHFKPNSSATEIVFGVGKNKIAIREDANNIYFGGCFRQALDRKSVV
jgi:hypothetical protein